MVKIEGDKPYPNRKYSKAEMNIWVIQFNFFLFFLFFAVKPFCRFWIKAGLPGASTKRQNPS